MNIRLIKPEDKEKVAMLIACFRVEHRKLKGITSSLKPDLALEELEEYLEANFPIYVAVDDSDNIHGYVVCRVDSDVVWVESIYVEETARKKGIAGRLFKKAEELAEELGGDTLYNWVLPDNDKIINFLAKQEYKTLNMIEIRKSAGDEKLSDTIKVGKHSYNY